MMGHRLKLKNGDEWDVVTPWRHLYCWTQRPGATAGVKRSMRRRERREGKATLEGDG